MCTAGCATALEKSVQALAGVLGANANFVAGTLRVEYDPARVSPGAITSAIRACGFTFSRGFEASHGAAASYAHADAPAHGRAHARAPVTAHTPAHTDAPVSAHGPAHGHAHDPDHGGAQKAPAESPHDAHAGMHHGSDLHAAARDMRRRFLVALAFAVPVFLWSPMGLMEPPPTPFGIDRELWLFVLGSGAVLYPGWPFFSAAIRSLRRGVLDMAVLVLLSVGTGYGFSLGSTFLFDGPNFYEASAVLLTFVLLGHWLEMRARAGASMWGDPRSIAGFLRYVSGQAFFRNMVEHDRLQIIAGYAGYLLRVSFGAPFVAALLLLSPRVARSSRRPRRWPR